MTDDKITCKLYLPAHIKDERQSGPYCAIIHSGKYPLGYLVVEDSLKNFLQDPSNNGNILRVYLGISQFAISDLGRHIESLDGAQTEEDVGNSLDAIVVKPENFGNAFLQTKPRI